MKVATNIFLFCFLSFISCSKTKTDNNNKQADSVLMHILTSKTKCFSLKDTTIKFLWREDRFDEKLKQAENLIYGKNI